MVFKKANSENDAKGPFLEPRGIARGAAPAVFSVLLASAFFPPVSPCLAEAEPAPVSLEVQANRDSLYIGESLVLTVRVNGRDAPEPAPELSGVTNAETRFLGSQSDSRISIVIVNGRMSRDERRARTFTYEIVPRSAGVFSTGPIRLRLDGRTVEHPGIQVSVLGIETQDFVVPAISASRSTVLVDEPFEIVFSIRLKRLPGQFADADPILPANPPHIEAPFLNTAPIEGLEMPDISKILEGTVVQRNRPGFTLNNYAAEPDIFDMDFSSFFERRPLRFLFPKRQAETNGVQYFEYSVKLTYTPRRPGNYTFGPALFKGSAIVNVDEQGRASTRPVFAVAPAITVRVVPPPEEGRPPSYIGVLGTRLDADVAVDTQSCKVGDVLTMTVSVSSDGRMDFATPPDLSTNQAFATMFRIYGDSVDTVQKGPNTRQFVYKLRPVQAGLCEIPPMELSYYDTNQRRYVTVTTKPVPIQVEQAASIEGSNILFATKQALEPANEEADSWSRPGPLIMSEAGADTESLGPATWNIAAASAGPLLLGLLHIVMVLKRRAPQIAAARRRNRAARNAVRRLRAVSSEPAADIRRTHAAIQEILRQYVSDRFEAPAGLDPETAVSVLRACCADAELAAEFGRVLDEHFHLSYAQTPSPSLSPAQYAARAESLIRRVEKSAAKSGRGFSSQTGGFNGCALLLFLLSFAGAQAFGEPSPQHLFLWQQANSLAMAAESRDDYMEAARVYNMLVASGARNGPLFYNLGTALLKAGRHAEAVQCFIRAERYMGYDPDLRRNLALALAGGARAKEPSLPWSRIVVFWHYGLPAGTRWSIALIGFVLFWPALALVTLCGRKRYIAPMLAAAAAAVIFGTSALTSIYEEAHALPLALDQPRAAGQGENNPP